MDSEKTPSLAVFWIAGTRLISYSVPLDRAEHVGGFANNPHGHAQLWPLVIRSYPRLRRKTYDEVPRGRVTYESAEGMFRLLLPRAVACDQRVVDRLITRFGLPPRRTRVIADAHYDPPATAPEV